MVVVEGIGVMVVMSKVWMWLVKYVMRVEDYEMVNCFVMEFC